MGLGIGKTGGYTEISCPLRSDYHPDSVWLPEQLQMVAELVEEHKPNILFCGVMIGSYGPELVLKVDDPNSTILHGNHPNKLDEYVNNLDLLIEDYERRIYNANNMMKDTPLPEDQDDRLRIKRSEWHNIVRDLRKLKNAKNN